MEVFEEQAIESTTQKPKIWKRYLDETITILDRSYVGCLLQHLNSQQPTIRFTMETEKDNNIVFLDSSVTREPYRRLTTCAYVYTCACAYVFLTVFPLPLWRRSQKQETPSRAEGL